MRILADHDDPLPARQSLDLADQRLQRRFLLALRAEVRQRVVRGRRQRQQIGENRHIFVRRRSAGEQGLEFLKLGSRQIVAGERSRVAELVDEREQRAVLVIRRAEIA